MTDIGGYDAAEDDNFDNYRQARQMLIDNTRKNLEDNLQMARLKKYDVFIVSNTAILSLVTGKALKKTPAFDEIRLTEAILKMAHSRRYGNQVSSLALAMGGGLG